MASYSWETSEEKEKAQSSHIKNPIQDFVLFKLLLMASNLEMIKLRGKGQEESCIACLLQGPSHAWERIFCHF